MRIQSVFILLVALPLSAHHSFDSTYDKSKQLELSGTVSKLEWMNPHVWVHLDVRDKTGKETTWACEFGSPNVVMRHGLSRQALSVGEKITVNGSAARDGSNAVNAITVKLANDSRIFQASSAAEAGP